MASSRCTDLCEFFIVATLTLTTEFPCSASMLNSRAFRCQLDDQTLDGDTVRKPLDFVSHGRDCAR